MKKALLAAAVTLLGACPLFAVNYVTNGDFSAGETGWTRYTEDWQMNPPSSYTWTTTGNGATLSMNYGTLALYQVVSNASIGQTGMTISGQWAGSQVAGEGGGDWWAEVMFFSFADATPALINAAIDSPATIATNGGVGGMAFKKDAWGMNQSTASGTWGSILSPDYLSLSLGPQPSQLPPLTNLGDLVVVIKYGGGTGGSVNFQNINVIPEPASLGLLALGAMAFLGRRRK